MIGWAVAGIPVEEYLFWFAFAWMVPFLYSGLSASPRIARLSAPASPNPAPALRSAGSSELPKARGYWGWWLIGSVIFILAALPWVGKRICWRALGWATAIFVSLMFLSESIALHWKWWIWNEDILWGPKVLQIPLEEFLLYFAIVPLLAVMQIMIQSRLPPRGGKTP
jgi:lycopene cyclase domain-containing protein